MKFLCELMSVNRSSYYKWLSRKNHLNRHQKVRQTLTELLKIAHEKYKSYGYHRLATIVRRETDLIFSDNLAHKCCKYSGIKSKARRRKYRKHGDEHVFYPNIINGKWNAVKPLELVVSDMTCIKHRGQNYEWTYMLDTFNNEIIAYDLSKKVGDRKPYFNCLEQLKKKIEKQTTQTILHTDQGTVYSSRAFREAHKDYNIIRSMSRAGTPTDNPIIESINGWIKAEMITDFRYWEEDNIYEFIDKYINYYNFERPAYSLKYKTPVQFKIEQGFG
ncbi:IS3 family transposase [Clostridium saccharoperbutylacetonicum]|uniref:IS3 family transposase n=1 Tax=Clostridium saccharoperbutylacetonicum TaxID=36745 RepID=UPI001EED7BC2|nr:IS3 family transposase [Clostridium saccharoperbutylacetonicum]